MNLKTLMRKSIGRLNNSVAVLALALGLLVFGRTVLRATDALR